MAHASQRREDADYTFHLGRDPAPRKQVPTYFEVLGDSQSIEHVLRLRYVPHSGARACLSTHRCDLAIADPHTALVDAQLSNERLQQRALAGAVRSEQRNDLTEATLEGDVVDDRWAPVAGS